MANLPQWPGIRLGARLSMYGLDTSGFSMLDYTEGLNHHLHKAQWREES